MTESPLNKPIVTIPFYFLPVFFFRSACMEHEEMIVLFWSFLLVWRRFAKAHLLKQAIGSRLWRRGTDVARLFHYNCNIKPSHSCKHSSPIKLLNYTISGKSPSLKPAPLLSADSCQGPSETFCLLFTLVTAFSFLVWSCGLARRLSTYKMSFKQVSRLSWVGRPHTSCTSLARTTAPPLAPQPPHCPLGCCAITKGPGVENLRAAKESMGSERERRGKKSWNTGTA